MVLFVSGKLKAMLNTHELQRNTIYISVINTSDNHHDHTFVFRQFSFPTYYVKSQAYVYYAMRHAYNVINSHCRVLLEYTAVSYTLTSQEGIDEIRNPVFWRSAHAGNQTTTITYPIASFPPLVKSCADEHNVLIQQNKSSTTPLLSNWTFVNATIRHCA